MELPDDRSLTGTPLVVDGVMYFTGSYSKTKAVDAKSGKLIWEYDPESIKHAGDRLRVMWDQNKGLALWKGKVIISTIDGRCFDLSRKGICNEKKNWGIIAFQLAFVIFRHISRGK
jgi:quinohemoprotein ethanol dehydrogenase